MNIFMPTRVANVKQECIIVPMNVIGSYDADGIADLCNTYPLVAESYIATINSNAQNVLGAIGKREIITVDNNGLTQDVALVYCRSPAGNNWQAYLNAVKEIASRGYTNVAIYVSPSVQLDRLTIDEADRILGACNMDIWIE